MQIAMSTRALGVPSASTAGVGGATACPAPWSAHMEALGEALAHGDVGAAGRALRQAHASVLRAPQWQGLIDVGDAHLRLGQASASRRSSTAEARVLYLAALYRARRQASLDGVLRATEAFAALGDHTAAESGLDIARGVAAGQVRERVGEATARLAARRLEASHLAPRAFARPASPLRERP